MVNLASCSGRAGDWVGSDGRGLPGAGGSDGSTVWPVGTACWHQNNVAPSQAALASPGQCLIDIAAYAKTANGKLS